MPTLLDRLPHSVRAGGLRAVYGLPRRVKRLLAGPPLRLDGLELALDAQLMLRLYDLADLPPLASGTPEQARVFLGDSGKLLLTGEPIGPMDITNIRIPVSVDNSGGGGVDIGARLYVPAGLPAGSPLLVYFHGGGFVIGDLDSHDSPCRFLAKHGQVRVLSVDYRLAPEHPFPVPVNDALAAFRYAYANARDLGANPDGIAVGGDSAGGNLSTVICLVTAREGGPKPVFQLLFYPATDATRQTRSRELFGDKGLFLTQDDITWFMGHYATSEADKSDPRYSPLLAEDLTGLPPAYLATAGFDPLRDEGEAYAERLRAAGVPVVLSRQADLIHGYANFIDIGNRFREAMFEAVGALRTGLGITVRESVAK